MRVLEGIFVQADGPISLRFKGESLFAPVVSYMLDGAVPVRGVAEARCEHQDLHDDLRKRVAGVQGGHVYVSEQPDTGVCYAHVHVMDADSFRA